jgi:hypothetical protein
LGIDLVAGRNRVPKPATGKTALRMRLVINFLEAMCRASLNPLSVDVASVSCGPGVKPFPGCSKGAGERALSNHPTAIWR